MDFYGFLLDNCFVFCFVFRFVSLDPGLRVWQLGFLGLRLGTGQEVGSFRMLRMLRSLRCGFRMFQIFLIVFQTFSNESRNDLLVVRHDQEIEKVMEV